MVRHIHSNLVISLSFDVLYNGFKETNNNNICNFCLSQKFYIIDAVNYLLRATNWNMAVDIMAYICYWLQNA